MLEAGICRQSAAVPGAASGSGVGFHTNVTPPELNVNIKPTRAAAVCRLSGAVSHHVSLLTLITHSILILADT